MKNKKYILVIKNMIIFPNNNLRLEFDNDDDKKEIELFDKIKDNLVIIVNPINDDNISLTALPKYGVLCEIKLKMNVPNNKTRIILEGLDRVEIFSIIEENEYFKTNYKIIKFKEDTTENKYYYKLLIKQLENYIAKVPYMGNAILSQLDDVKSLNELTDLIASFLPLEYNDKKKYSYTIDEVKRAKYLIEDMIRDIKFAELE